MHRHRHLERLRIPRDARRERRLYQPERQCIHAELPPGIRRRRAPGETRHGTFRCRNRLVVEATVFDVFEGEGLPAGKKSIAIRLVYRSLTRTLTAEDIIRAEKSILTALETRLGAALRA